MRGPGKIAGFTPGANIHIENASHNDVSQLILREGRRGVGILSSDGGSAGDNHIFNNSIKFTSLGNTSGIEISSEGVDSHSDENQLNLNIIQGARAGINLETQLGATANANEIYTNVLKDCFVFSILLRSRGSMNANNIYANSMKAAEGASNNISIATIITGAFDSNRINDNKLEGSNIGIGIQANPGTSAKHNFLIKNRIIQPDIFAIALLTGVATSNLIANNSTEITTIQPVYCDFTGQPNYWQINFINFFPVIGPQMCV